MILRRLAAYLAATDWTSDVVIVDSSSRPCRDENLSTVADFGSRLKIRWFGNELGFLEKCASALKRIETPYVVLCDDDEFLMPNATLQAVDFLAEHIGFSVAMAITASLHTHREGRCYALPGRSVTSDSPVVRFRAVAKAQFTTLNSVQRTESLKRGFSEAARFTNFDSAKALSETVISQSSVLHGRIQFLPITGCLKIVRERECRKTPYITDVDNHDQHFNRFRECLVEGLQDSGATRDHAEIMIDDLYRHFRIRDVTPASPASRVATKVQREVLRHCRRVIDIVRSENILQRRRLRTTDLAGQGEAWRIAKQFVDRFPDGIPQNMEEQKRFAA